MMYNSIEVTYLADTLHMDLCLVNMQIKTFLLKKISEPNIFKSVIEVDGDARQAIVNEFLKRKTV